MAVLRALALNAGSSTLKASLYELDPAAGSLATPPPSARWEAQVDWRPG
jgi:acetate kinase